MTKVKRGVVIGGACDIRREGNSEIFRVADLDGELINTALLYWDRIDIPDSTFVSVELPSKMDLLVKEGVLTRKEIPLFRHGCSFGLAQLSHGAVVNIIGTEINGQKVNVADVVNAAPMQAFNELVLDKTTDWAFIQNNLKPNTSESSEIADKRALLFEIHNALPVPSADTPYEKILEFKNKRESELISFRSEMDEAYLRVLGAKDLEIAKSLEFRKLEKALLDLEKAAQADLIGNIKRSIKIPTTVEGVSDMAVGALATFGMGSTAGIISLLISAAKYIDLSELLKGTKIPEHLTPLQYVLDVKRELL